MSYSNGLLQSNNTNITPIKGPRGEKGDPGVGFDVTPEGNFNLNKKRVIGLKTPDDVAIDDSIENYSRDLETAVNKRYLNQFFLKKNRNETVFDCAGLSLQNTEVYYPSLYNDRSVPNVGYVSAEDNKVRTEIDTKLATKADKSYADNTYLTKKSGGVLAQSLQNKADKSYVENTFLKKVVGRVLTQKILSKLDIHGSNMMQANLDMNDNRITNLSKPIYGTDGVNKLYVDSSHITSIDKGNVFNNIMIDSDNQLSEENDIELGDLIHHPNPVHQINKKVIDTKLLLDSSKNYYSSRLGINMYPIPINYYTMAFELYFPVEIDENSVDISVVSLIDTVNKVTTRVYNGYSRTIAQVHKYQQHNNNYLYVDIVLKMKSGHSYVPKLQTYIIIYGIKNYESNVEPSIYDQLYYVENDRIAFNASIDMKTQAIHGIAEGTTDDQAVNYKQLMSSIGLTVIGTVVGSITLNPIVIGCLTGSGVLIHGYITKSNISDKVNKCKFAYTSYEKVCIQIKCFLRGLPSDENAFLTDLKVLDDIVIDQCPTVDEYVKKYYKKFTSE
ncbi:hypothetical protein ACROYT_G035381 [Oculina patagonica]